MKTNKRKSEMPTRKINTALLGEEVGKNWDLQFSHLQVSNLNARTMQAEATRLRSLLAASSNNFNQLKQNTVDLRDLNKLMDSALNTLKNHIKTLCWQTNNLEAEYGKYGLLRMGTAYRFPTDNGLRQVALEFLVAKLQEPNNPIANQAQGLTFWADAQARHALLWNGSNQMRANKSLLAQQTDTLTDKIQADLKRVRKMLEIQYSGIDLMRQKRAIGFLKESL